MININTLTLGRYLFIIGSVVLAFNVDVLLYILLKYEVKKVNPKGADR